MRIYFCFESQTKAVIWSLCLCPHIAPTKNPFECPKTHLFGWQEWVIRQKIQYESNDFSAIYICSQLFFLSLSFSLSRSLYRNHLMLVHFPKLHVLTNLLPFMHDICLIRLFMLWIKQDYIKNISDNIPGRKDLKQWQPLPSLPPNPPKKKADCQTKIVEQSMKQLEWNGMDKQWNISCFRFLLTQLTHAIFPIQSKHAILLFDQQHVNVNEEMLPTCLMWKLCFEMEFSAIEARFAAFSSDLSSRALCRDYCYRIESIYELVLCYSISIVEIIDLDCDRAVFLGTILS